MRLATSDGRELWLAYCMNVHPGGTLASTLDALRHTVRPLKARLGVTGAFGVGLRFDAATAHALDRDPEAFAALRDALAVDELVPFTGNAFVLGAFHAPGVKAGVYRPTWAEPERVDYTLAFARVLARLAPASADVSLSTSPGGWGGQDARSVEAYARGMAEVGRGLRRLRDETGVTVRLAFEPEPGCTFDTTDDAIAFWGGALREAFDGDAEARAHVGVCFDVCHQAVMHEDVGAALVRLHEAGVPIPKLQASSALEVPDLADPEARRVLAAFDEPVYLHQAAAPRAEGGVAFVEDLPALLADAARHAERGPWRVHFHVPVFRESLAGPLRATRPELERALGVAAGGDPVPHVEIETYTWDVLPEIERAAGVGFDLGGALEREYRFVLEVLSRAGFEPVGEA